MFPGSVLTGPALADTVQERNIQGSVPKIVLFLYCAGLGSRACSCVLVPGSHSWNTFTTYLRMGSAHTREITCVQLAVDLWQFSHINGGPRTKSPDQCQRVG
jgi:hypothetical protein